ncbi:MAG: Cdc6/Cdc18 family protein [Planctomycetota bacterium]|jgi:cell division control protein 6
METSNIKTRLFDEMENVAGHDIIVNARYLNDEQLIHSEQLQVFEEIFNANVRNEEMTQLSRHFAPILKDNHPTHLALWGKTGTGKTLTMRFFMGILAEMCKKKKIPLRLEHLNLATSRPCFRALNDLACLLNASKRYKRGVSLVELMYRIESALADFKGYFVLFVDEVDNVRTDPDTFMSFLVRRLPQSIPAKLILVFASNKLNWRDSLDPRILSFLKIRELLFNPYNADDLQHILRIRVKKALAPGAVEPGVIEKIAALSSHDHGDARQAVDLLARSAELAQAAGTGISMDIVDRAAEEIEQDKYSDMIRTAPAQMQAAMAAIILTARKTGKAKSETGEVYEQYQAFCREARMRPVAIRAFRESLNELDLYGFVRTRIFSRGRHGRTREVILELDEELVSKIYGIILLNFQLRQKRSSTTGPADSAHSVN